MLSYLRESFTCVLFGPEVAELAESGSTGDSCLLKNSFDHALAVYKEIKNTLNAYHAQDGNNKSDDEAVVRAVSSFMVVLEGALQNNSSALAEGGRHVVKPLMEEFASANHVLLKLAGGGLAGAKWNASYNEENHGTLLDFYKSTLQASDQAARDKAVEQVAVVRRSIESHCHEVKTVIPGTEVLTPPTNLHEDFVASQALVDLAKLTRLENFLGQALTVAKKPTKVIRKATAEYADQTGKDWKNDVDPNLVELCSEKLQVEEGAFKGPGGETGELEGSTGTP